MTKARNIADLGSNDVIETTSTGVDVTGTVTADAVSVTQTGSTTALRAEKSQTGQIIVAYNGASVNYLDADTQYFRKGDGTKLGEFSGGDFHLYEDTGTTAKFVWDSSAEELEIGSSTDKLELGASFQRFRKGNENKILIGNTSSALGSGTGLINYLYDPEPFIWYQGAERMRIDSSGNVGIGTDSPSTKLMLEHSNDGAVGGTIRIKDRDSQQVPGQLTGAIEFESEDATMPTSGVSTAIKAYCASTAGGSYLTLSTTDQYTSTLDERVRITDSGRVGIGTNSPASALHVRDSGNPTITVDGSDGAYTSFLTLKAAGAGASVIRAEGGTNSLVLQTNGDNERARIDSSGNLLVGSTSTANGTPYVTSGKVQGSLFTSNNYSVDNVGSTFVSSGLSVGNTRGAWIVTIQGSADTNGSSIATYILTKAAYDTELVQLGNTASHFHNVYVEAQLSSPSASAVTVRVRFTGSNLTGTGTIHTSAMRIG